MMISIYNLLIIIILIDSISIINSLKLPQQQQNVLSSYNIIRKSIIVNEIKKIDNNIRLIVREKNRKHYA